MRDEHLTAASLEILLTEDRTEDENRLLLHQLATCPDCYADVGYVLDLYRAGAIDLAFSSVDLGLAKSRAEAPQLWQELKKKPLEAWRRTVRRTRHFQSWGLCEILCAESLAVAPHDAAAAVARAELAVTVAGLLREWEPAEIGWLAQLRGIAWAHLGNARRVFGDLRRAHEGFVEADRFWAPAMADFGDVLGYAARFYGLKASLRREERQFEEAIALLDEALRYTTDPEWIGKLSLNKAKVLEEQGETEAAIELLMAASNHVQALESRTVLCLEHNLVWSLASCGRCLEARLRLPSVQERSQRLGNDLDMLRLRWTEGRIAAGLADFTNAAALLLEVRHGFEARGIGFDAALVTLELAVVYARQNRSTDVMALAGEMLPLLEANGVQREALVVVSLFVEAAADGRLTAELAEQVLAQVWQVIRRSTGARQWKGIAEEDRPTVEG